MYNKSLGAKEALERKLRRGEWSNQIPFGYRKKFNGGSATIIVDEDEGPIVAKAFELYATRKYSLNQVCKLLNEMYSINWRRSYLARLLANPFYYGIMRSLKNNAIYPHAYGNIVTKELFDAAQFSSNTIKKDKRTYGKKPFIYRSLITCGTCGCSITAEEQKNNYYYHCTQSKGKHDAIWIREELITEQFIVILKKLYQQVSPYIDKKLLETTVQIDEIKPSLKEYIIFLSVHALGIFSTGNLDKKRALISFLFKDIQLLENKIIYTITQPFESLLTSDDIAITLESIRPQFSTFAIYALLESLLSLEEVIQKKVLITDTLEQKILALCKNDPQSINELIQKTNDTLANIQDILIDLQLKGLVDENMQGNWYTI